jgi:hypothetical protein
MKPRAAAAREPVSTAGRAAAALLLVVARFQLLLAAGAPFGQPH